MPVMAVNVEPPLIVLFVILALFPLGISIWKLRFKDRERREIDQKLERLVGLEAEYRDFFDNASDAVFAHDLEGKITSVNLAFAETLGYSREEMLGRIGFDFVADESRPLSMEMFARKLKDGQPTRYEADFLCKDGKRVHFELVTRLVTREGKPVGIHGVARDITERRREEFRKRIFLDLGHKLNQSYTYERAADIVLEAAQQLIGFDSCFFDVLDERGENCRVLVLADTVLGKLQRMPCSQEYSPLPGLARTAIEKGASLILRKPDEMENPQPPTEIFGVPRRSASIMVVPIRTDERILGILGLHSYKFNAYDNSMLESLAALADYCEGAFERIQAREEIEATLLDMERRVTTRTLELSALNESLQREVEERKRAENALLEAQAGLEMRVAERTEELSATNYKLRREISKHMQTSTALQQSEQRFRALIEASPVGVALSRNGIILYANRAHLEMFGFTDMWQLKGRAFIELVAPQCQTQVLERIKRRMVEKRERDSYETVGVHRNGSQFFYQVETAKMQLDDGPATLAFLIDTNERHNALLALRQSEERFSRAFHALPIPVSISTLAEGLFIDVNEVFLRLFEYSRNEVVGHTVRDINLWADYSERDSVIALLNRGESVHGREVRFRTHGGRTLVTNIFVERVELQGRPCLIFITQDQTERLNLETQLRHSQKMEAVGQLAAGVAHDFNNIMTIILGHASLLKREKTLNQMCRESVTEIIAASDRAAGLTRQLLTFSRKQVMQLRSVDLNGLIEEFSKMLDRLIGENISLKLDFSPELGHIRVDPGMMEQVIMNLAVNARDAMSQGGYLTISTRPVEMEESGSGQKRSGHYACLTISDTGCGMSPETQSHIFEPFFTTKEVGKGTGLGLATVYGIVEQHHGRIEVESQVGRGTTFRVYMPMIATEHTHATNTAELPASKRGGETVLVAEDEAGLLQLIQHILQRGGYRVLSATTGDDAWMVWLDHAGEIDLLLTDMMMPGGMSGKDLAERILEERPNLPVIYSTGYSLETVREGLELIDGKNFLPKPYPPAKLLKMIRESLGGQNHPAQNSRQS